MYLQAQIVLRRYQGNDHGETGQGALEQLRMVFPEGEKGFPLIGSGKDPVAFPLPLLGAEGPALSDIVPELGIMKIVFQQLSAPDGGPLDGIGEQNHGHFSFFPDRIPGDG